METILNLLVLDAEAQNAFARAFSGHRQFFAPDGCFPGTETPIPEKMYRDATIILGNPPVELVAKNPHLKMLHTRSAGVDRYLKPGILAPDTVLAGSSGAWGPSMAEHMFALLLALMKRLPAYYEQQKTGVWQRRHRSKGVIGSRVLVIGTGDLGSSFAQRCKAFGAETAGIRRDPEKPAEGIDEMYGSDALDEQLSLADVVCLMLPHTRETSKLMNLQKLCLMKPDAILLNGGRGTAVDCDALAEVMESGHLWGAGLDVTYPEPLPPDHPLWKQARVLLTPHTAGGHLDDTFRRIAEIVLENLKHYFAGEPLRNQFDHT